MPAGDGVVGRKLRRGDAHPVNRQGRRRRAEPLDHAESSENVGGAKVAKSHRRTLDQTATVRRGPRLEESPPPPPPTARLGLFDLPEDVLYAVLSRLETTNQLVRCRRVCRRLDRLIRTGGVRLWAHIDVRWHSDRHAANFRLQPLLALAHCRVRSLRIVAERVGAAGATNPTKGKRDEVATCHALRRALEELVAVLPYNAAQLIHVDVRLTGRAILSKGTEAADMEGFFTGESPSSGHEKAHALLVPPLTRVFDHVSLRHFSVHTEMPLDAAGVQRGLPFAPAIERRDPPSNSSSSVSVAPRSLPEVVRVHGFIFSADADALANVRELHIAPAPKIVARFSHMLARCHGRLTSLSVVLLSDTIETLVSGKYRVKPTCGDVVEGSVWRIPLERLEALDFSMQGNTRSSARFRWHLPRLRRLRVGWDAETMLCFDFRQLSGVRQLSVGETAMYWDGHLRGHDPDDFDGFIGGPYVPVETLEGMASFVALCTELRELRLEGACGGRQIEALFGGKGGGRGRLGARGVAIKEGVWRERGVTAAAVADEYEGEHGEVAGRRPRLVAPQLTSLEVHVHGADDAASMGEALVRLVETRAKLAHGWEWRSIEAERRKRLAGATSSSSCFSSSSAASASAATAAPRGAMNLGGSSSSAALGGGGGGGGGAMRGSGAKRPGGAAATAMVGRADATRATAIQGAARSETAAHPSAASASGHGAAAPTNIPGNRGGEAAGGGGTDGVGVCRALERITVWVRGHARVDARPCRSAPRTSSSSTSAAPASVLPPELVAWLRRYVEYREVVAAEVPPWL